MGKDWLKFLTAIFLTGCQSMPPQSDMFWAIYSEPYILDVYDCSNKSSKYARALRDSGSSSNIWITRLDDGGTHAIVSVNVDNQTIWCDQTNGEWSSKSGEFGELIFMVPYGTRLNEVRWGKSFF